MGLLRYFAWVFDYYDNCLRYIIISLVAFLAFIDLKLELNIDKRIYSRTLCVASKHPITSISHVKRHVASIGHFKATPQSALVHLTKNNCLPAESNKQRSRRQVVFIFQYYCSANS